ncbi:hypothetical protein DM02DRAFT_621663 [Periconia macrospinosa]|uniref:Rhodopsin domain-containing protein n=1 Tax=Periconia macrospinosa TaxID=97972 RepID=A0A2V1EF81_9PLEO|nr:hypothetical protein DM02DRAFT_621663 [Periconia macrospinosa]
MQPTQYATGSVVANLILPLLAVAGVVVRFVVRSRYRQGIKGDDWTILAALILCVGIASSSIWAAYNHLHGVPWDTLTPDKWISSRKLQFSDILVCHLIYGLTKISIVLFYKRVFTLGRFRIAANATLALIIVFIILSFFMVLFCARGVSTFWTTPPMLDGTQYVILPADLITAFAIVDLLLDILVLSLPLPSIWRLQMSRSKRFAVAGVFLLGAFCLVCSCVRLYYVRALFGFTAKSKLWKVSDENDLWAHIEAYASTLTACLPTLRPLLVGSNGFNSFFSSFRSLLTRSEATTKEGSQESLGKGGNIPSTDIGTNDKTGWHELPEPAR